MRTHALLALTGAVVSASAVAADVPLSVLNGGPSSDSIPTAADSPVAFIVAPREIVDPSIAIHLPIADLTGNSLLVQDAANPTASGVRSRSRAVLALSNTRGDHSPYLLVQANLDFEPLASASYLLMVFDDDATTINSVNELHAFLANMTPGVDYLRVFLDNSAFTHGSAVGGGYTDADISKATMSTDGLRVYRDDIVFSYAGTPVSPLDMDLGIIVFSDGDGPGSDIPTEYFCMRSDPLLIRPMSAELKEGGVLLSIATNIPAATDGARTLVDYDTDPTTLNGGAFRVRDAEGGPVRTLSAFLEKLSSPRNAIGFGISGDRRDIIDIVFDAPIAEADVDAVLNMTVGLGQGLTTASVYSFAGEVPTAMPATYVPINRPPCPGVGNDADTNDDLVIDFTDLNAVLSVFGQTGMNLPADTNGDGVINFTDLNAVLSSYGSNCF